MGFFGTYVYQRGGWSPAEPAINDVRVPVRGDEPPPGLAEPWLLVDIHDSDFTIVTYRPAGPGTGTAYLGITPRVYFEDDTASAPTDVAREAAGLAAWWQEVHGNGDGAARDAKAAELAAFLADDQPLDDEDDDEDDDADYDDEEDEDDDAEVFVEIKTGLFVEVLGLPEIGELSGEE